MQISRLPQGNLPLRTLGNKDQKPSTPPQQDGFHPGPDADPLTRCVMKGFEVGGWAGLAGGVAAGVAIGVRQANPIVGAVVGGVLGAMCGPTIGASLGALGGAAVGAFQ
ncbi:MAG: hypothetical protein J0I12_33380 [Candidatus Eremiobacteraeota bacterium]|nr:hypothetical protein [Candidatus Eremiobacteraeota bacterium]